MKIYSVLFLFTTLACRAQQKIENIIIITTDGLRWREVFTGMDSAIANNPKFNGDDSAYLFQNYWSDEVRERRRKLFPFLWSTVEAQGQLWGNREYGNNVNNANPYWFSYPGYSEMMTGYADTAVNSNDFPPNPNTSVLEFLNRQGRLRGRVAAFGAWNAFDRILNEQRSGLTVISAFDKSGGSRPTGKQQLINAMLEDSYKPWGDGECLDVFTHYAAMEELKGKQPKMLYIAYGETDEWAHSGKYRDYLEAAHRVDAWIGQIWNYVQRQPGYKNKTALFISTDHGRWNALKGEWRSHGRSIDGAGAIWLAVLGPTLPAKGEVRSEMQLYQKQFAQTIAKMMGYTFSADHPVEEEIKPILQK